MPISKHCLVYGLFAPVSCSFSCMRYHFVRKIPARLMIISRLAGVSTE